MNIFLVILIGSAVLCFVYLLYMMAKIKQETGLEFYEIMAGEYLLSTMMDNNSR